MSATREIPNVSRLSSAISGNLFQNIAEKLISLSLISYLARTLTPNDFGTVAAIMIFVEIGLNITNLGLGASIVTCTALTKEIINTSFTIAMLSGLFFLFLIFVFHKFFLTTLNLTSDSSILYSLALILFMHRFGQISMFINFRFLKYNLVSLLSLFSCLFAALFSFYLSHHNFGIWALVFYYLSQSVLNNLGLFFFTKIKPQFGFSRKAFSEIYSLAKYNSFSLFAGMLSDRLIPFGITKWIGVAEVGLFSIASRPSSIVWQVVVTAFQKTTLPTIYFLLNEKKNPQAAFNLFFLPVVFFIFPLTFFLCFESRSVILFLFGSRWLQAANILQFLSLSVLMAASSYMTDAFFSVSKHSNFLLWLGVIKLLFAFLVLLIFLDFGLEWIAFGMFLFSFLYFLVCIGAVYVFFSCNFLKTLLFYLKPTLFILLGFIIYSVFIYFLNLLGFDLFLIVKCFLFLVFLLLMFFLCYGFYFLQNPLLVLRRIFDELL